MSLSGTGTGVALADEYRALADLLESSTAAVWDAPSLCEGWRTREVVAHVTMAARYSDSEFMKELEAAGGDFTTLSNTVAARDGSLPAEELLACLRSEVLHSWEPPGGGPEGALTHCVIHQLDIVEALPLPRRVPAERIARVLGILTETGAPDIVGHRPVRRGAAGRRPGVVLRLGRAGVGAGAGAGARGLRAHGAGVPTARQSGGALQPLTPRRNDCVSWRASQQAQTGADDDAACSTGTRRRRSGGRLAQRNRGHVVVPRPPGPVAAGQVAGTPESELPQRGRGQARCIAL